MKEYNYNVYVPSGNPTALVKGLVLDENERKVINDAIIAKYNDYVEQVGFIDTDVNKPQLLMAGGEFCGNATRSAIYYYLNGKRGNLDIKVSGVQEALNGGIDDNNMTWVNMPIIKGNYDLSVKKINDLSAIVRMYGITHMIVEADGINEQYTKDELKKIAFKMLEDNDLTKEDAAGVMFIEKSENGIILSPIVFVRAINTLFYETACGSGTTAVGVYESFKNKGGINQDIIQPSGQIINVETIANEREILNAKISGVVKEYEKGKVLIK